MDTTRDEGFSLVEVVIAMFLLMVLSLAVLPLAITAMRSSVGNADIAAATTFANAQLAPISAAFPNDPVTPTTCSALRTRAVSGVADPAGTGLRADVTVGTCPAAYPGSVTVTITVAPSGGGARLVSLPTRVSVSAP